MKVEGRIFASLAAFFVLVAAVYGWLSREVIGTTALILSGALALAIGFYSLRLSARLGPRPEDRPDAEISEGAGEYGFYSPHSWWPLPTAASAAIMMLGFAFGWWLTVLGAVLPRQQRRRVRVRVLPRLPRRGLTDQGSAVGLRACGGPPRRTRRGLLRRRGPAVPEQPVRLGRRRSAVTPAGAQRRACARTRSSRCAPATAGSPRWTCGRSRGGAPCQACSARDGSTWTVVRGHQARPGHRRTSSRPRRRRRGPRPDRQGHVRDAHADQGSEHGRHAGRRRGRRRRHADHGGLHREGDRPGGRRARPAGHHVQSRSRARGAGSAPRRSTTGRQTYWPAGEHVTVTFHLAGVDAGGGVWGDHDRSYAFDVTPTALVSTVDITAHTMTVRQDGGGAARHPGHHGQGRLPAPAAAPR